MKACVSVPFADIRNKPERNQHARIKDLVQETQVLYGDPLHIVHYSDDWCQVQVLNQLFYDPLFGWMSYPGWIERRHLVLQEKLPASNIPAFNITVTAKNVKIAEKENLYFSNLYFSNLYFSMGTKLFGKPSKTAHNQLSITLLDERILELDERACRINDSKCQNYPLSQKMRKEIVTSAKLHIGDPYFWGGMTSYCPEYQDTTGVDCSGFISLLFRHTGKLIARNARDQFKQCRIISGKELEPADLIFMKNKNSPHIDHVMLYAGDETIIEATVATSSVRKISTSKRLGNTLSGLVSGMDFEGSHFYFGKLIE